MLIVSGVFGCFGVCGIEFTEYRGLWAWLEIHILYVIDNVSEVNHFPIYRIQVGWVHYVLFYPIIESFIDPVKYFGVDLGICDC